MFGTMQTKVPYF